MEGCVPMHEWFYLSFVDPDGPEGDRFLGGCYVQLDEEHRHQDETDAQARALRARTYPLGDDALQVWRATSQAHRLGINPGGEVVGVGPVPEAAMDRVPPALRHRLLSRDDLGVAIR